MRVGVQLRSRHLGLLDALDVVVALHLVTLVVEQRRVASEDASSDAGKVDGLRTFSRPSDRTRMTPVPLCMRWALVWALAGPYGQSVHAS